jgi:hypothetical protein
MQCYTKVWESSCVKWEEEEWASGQSVTYDPSTNYETIDYVLFFICEKKLTQHDATLNADRAYFMKKK